ncbi:hypothetical protein VitviT2T_019862 [Vitis vinifera]|uniref:ADP-ribosyl cyclase/cyclic ADP-ribose hydrolase n=1 Tax=Vitis vinifera TaxID=29760 RepID=A0ABY9D493_VITVI|nr:hypothetical protein VitviT2T_019862 [Vitis vinifera]
MAISSSSSSFSFSSSSSLQRGYDVFLSFRGEDTRNNFTAHLYKELHTKGIEDSITEFGSVEFVEPEVIETELFGLHDLDSYIWGKSGKTKGL